MDHNYTNWSMSTLNLQGRAYDSGFREPANGKAKPSHPKLDCGGAQEACGFRVLGF